MLPTELAGEFVKLTASGAIFWPARSTLFIADTHLGKPAAFRAAGLPAPEALTAHDLDRLGDDLDRTRAERLVVLGDLLHHRTGRTPDTLDAVAAWRGRRESLDVLVIRGNHDRHAGDPPESWRMRIAEEGVGDGPFSLRHEAPDAGTADGRFVLAGHLHPVTSLRAHGVGRGRFRCFWIRPSATVLPAFARFAGGHPVRARRDDRLVLLTPDGLIDIRPNAKMVR